MKFSNPLYSAVTSQFFDYLAKNITQAFEKRCYELYYKDKKISDTNKHNGDSIRKINEIPNKLKTVKSDEKLEEAQK